MGAPGDREHTDEEDPSRTTSILSVTKDAGDGPLETLALASACPSRVRGVSPAGVTALGRTVTLRAILDPVLMRRPTDPALLVTDRPQARSRRASLHPSQPSGLLSCAR
jgi:hypothetical protein